MKIAVSFLKSEHDKKSTIQYINQSIADYIHVDIMDGEFVQNKNASAKEFIELLKNSNKPLDIHLMVNNPLSYIKELIVLKNIEFITFHYELNADIQSLINYCTRYNIKAGLAINPNTNIIGDAEILKYLPSLSQILVMSVNPGIGGQSFIPDILDKITWLKKIKIQNGYQYLISVDGGINEETAKLCKNSGAEMLACGYFVCQSDSFNQQIELLLK